MSGGEARARARVRGGGRSRTAARRAAWLAKFEQVATWAYAHLVDTEHGEWFGYADRDGVVTHRFKGGAYKGCFHVPRCLLMVSQLLAAV